MAAVVIDDEMRRTFPTLTDDQITLVLTTDAPRRKTDRTKVVEQIPDIASAVLDTFGYQGLQDWIRLAPGTDGHLEAADFNAILEASEHRAQMRYLEMARIVLTANGAKNAARRSLIKDLQKSAGVKPADTVAGMPMAGEE